MQNQLEASRATLNMSVLMDCLFLSSAVQAEGRNSFLPTRNHNPEGQQLGVYFVP